LDLRLGKKIKIVRYGVSSGGVLFTEEELSFASNETKKDIQFFDVLRFEENDFVVISGGILINLSHVEEHDMIKIFLEDEETIKKVLQREETLRGNMLLGVDEEQKKMRLNK